MTINNNASLKRGNVNTLASHFKHIQQKQQGQFVKQDDRDEHIHLKTY